MIFSARYEVLDKIGQGGMGVVYRVRHVDLRTILALKVLSPDLAQDKDLVARFEREAQVMARLNHRNIVRVFDLAVDNGTYYLVMEFLQGKDLRQHLRDVLNAQHRPLDLDEVLRIGVDLASALAYAHEQTPAVIHRDIKSANILIEDGTQRVAITDFGIAKLIGDSRTKMTRTGGFVGTVKYCSPEQLRHDVDIDGRADVYSLGMVLYELFMGRQLFEGLSEEEAIGRILYETSDKVALSDSEPAFAEILGRAIARDREVRHPSASSLAADLQACRRALRGTAFSDPSRGGTAHLAADHARPGDADVSSEVDWPVAGDEPAGLDDGAWGRPDDSEDSRSRSITTSIRWRIRTGVRYLAARWWVVATIVPALIIAAMCAVDGLSWVGRPFPGFFVMENAVVPTAGAYHWTGMHAGLPNHSTILRVDGHSLQDGNDLYAYSEQVPIGTTLTYTVRKSDTTFDIPIATMAFTWWDYALTFGLLGLNGFVIILTGFAVAMLSPKTRPARVFLLMSLLIGLYPVTGCDLWRKHEFTWLQLLLQCVGPATFLHLALVFPVERRMTGLSRTLAFYLPYVAGAVLTVFLFRGFWSNPVNLFPLYVGYAYSAVGFVAMVASGVLSYAQYRRALVRGRVQVIMVGVVIAFVLPIVGFFNNMLGGGDFPLNYIAFTPPFFFIAVAYAIVKHKLFDVQVFIRRSVVVACFFAAFTALYVAAISMVNTSLAQVKLLPRSPEFMGGFMAISLATALPLRDRLSAAIEKRLFPHKHRFHETIKALSRSIASIVDLRAVLDEAMRGLAEGMQITAGSILLHDPSANELQMAASFGNAPAVYAVRTDSAIVRLLSTARSELFAEDLQEDPDLAALREEGRSILAALRAELIVPLFCGPRMVGVLALGRTQGSDTITSEDLRVLRSLASALAIAVVRSVDAFRVERMQLERQVLERYLPPNALRELAGKDSAAFSHSGVMTTVSARLLGLDEFAEVSAPESAMYVVRQFYTACGRTVTELGGTCEPFVGGCARAVFENSQSGDSHAVRAIHAALGIRRAVESYRDQWVGRGYEPSVAVGVASGFTHVVRIEAGSQPSIHVFGSTAVVADALSQRAAPGEVVAEVVAAMEVATELSVTDIRKLDLVELRSPVTVFNIGERVAA